MAVSVCSEDRFDASRLLNAAQDSLKALAEKYSCTYPWPTRSTRCPAQPQSRTHPSPARPLVDTIHAPKAAQADAIEGCVRMGNERSNVKHHVSQNILPASAMLGAAEIALSTRPVQTEIQSAVFSEGSVEKAVAGSHDSAIRGNGAAVRGATRAECDAAEEGSCVLGSMKGVRRSAALAQTVARGHQAAGDVDGVGGAHSLADKGRTLPGAPGCAEEGGPAECRGIGFEGVAAVRDVGHMHHGGGGVLAAAAEAQQRAVTAAELGHSSALRGRCKDGALSAEAQGTMEAGADGMGEGGVPGGPQETAVTEMMQSVVGLIGEVLVKLRLCDPRELAALGACSRGIDEVCLAPP
jgi:hypothetical protein